MLFPSVREFTVTHLAASTLEVVVHILKFKPIFAVIGLVLQFVVYYSFSAEILLIVRVHAVQSVMR